MGSGTSSATVSLFLLLLDCDRCSVFFLRPLADIEEVTRDWLKTFDGGKYERYSVCEVILTAPEFSHMKHCVGPADWFCRLVFTLYPV